MGKAQAKNNGGIIMPGIGLGICLMSKRKAFSFSSYWATRNPTLLNVTGMRDTEIDFSWTDNSAGDCSFAIYRSTDGVNYSSVGTTVAGDTTYTATGLTAGNLYYFRVVGVKSGNESDPTNVYDTYFKITIDTTKAGSAADTFVLPVTAKAAGSYFVDWGEGGAEEEFTTTGDKTHTYGAAGTYQVKVRGSMTAMAFNNAGDKDKLMYVDNWGNLAWSSMTNAFFGCAIMQGRYIDTPNLSAVTSMSSMFHDCTAFNQSVANFNTAKVTNMNSMFRNCPAFNQSVANFNTAAVTDMGAMFRNCHAFNQSVANFNTAKVTNMSTMFRNCHAFNQSLATFSLASASNLINMLNGCDINTAGTSTNYDNTLIAWAAQDAQNSLNFDGGTSKYGEGLVENGTTDGAAANKLIQSGQNFLTTVAVGDVVYNTTDGTYALVTAIDSDTQLSISADIMANAEVYRIQHSAAAKARASLILNDLWTITDGGYL